MKKTGKRSQLTGDRAETKVRNALEDAELFCSKFEKDRGEDLLVELGGYLDQCETIEPQIGLLQIKGHEADSNSVNESTRMKRRVKLDNLRRWAAIPLPVFVVAVELVGTTPLFFAKSVDMLVAEVAPDGLGELDQESITLRLPLLEDLPDFLKTEIKHFYLRHSFQLSGISDEVIARNHYEIISSYEPFVAPTANVWMRNLRVLWKGSWRPAHFWATLNNIADTLKEKDGGKDVPLFATIHVYRSLKDERDNNAIAHVTWLEDDHPATEKLRVKINWQKAVNWARFRFNKGASLDSLPEAYIIEEEDDDVYLEKVEFLWLKLDEIYQEICMSINEDMKVPDKKLRIIEKEIYDLNDNYMVHLGCPSPQFKIMDKMVNQYYFSLTGVITWIKGKKDVPEMRRQRWLRQDLDFSCGHYRVYQALKKVLREG